MSQFREFSGKVSLFKRNFVKDSHQRRQNSDVVNEKLEELTDIETNFNHLKDIYDKDEGEVKLVKISVMEMNNNISKELIIPLDRLTKIKSTNMPEKCVLRTASSLLPFMDSSEDTT
ncbi:hypothetical protein JTB14_002431 [Gonioctena quinquepunctata]|nr:hypothetical protein JTB14_002431 [Gonioctena quinquepunctata]